MNLHKILTIVFGVLSSLFVLNRFYDLLDGSSPMISILIIALSFHIFIILLIGLRLFYKHKKSGFWILGVFQTYLLIRHSYEFWSLKTYKPIINVPSNILEQLTMPHLDLIFYLELITGIVATAALVITNKKRKVANTI